MADKPKPPLNTDTQGDQQFEQSIETATALLAKLEAQAKDSDAAVRDFGKTLDDLTKKQKKLGLSGGSSRPSSSGGSSGEPKAPKPPKTPRETPETKKARKQAESLSAAAQLNKLGIKGSSLQSAPALFSALSGAATKAVPIIGLVAGSLTAMYKAGEAAHQRNLMVAQSLNTMKQASTAAGDAAIEQANRMNETSEKWKIIGDSMTQTFSSMFSGLRGLWEDFTDGLFSSLQDNSANALTAGANVNTKGVSSSILDYAMGLESQSTGTVSLASSLPVLRDISANAQQAGFDAQSAANLAIGTFDAAIKKAGQLGLKTEDVARQLADAWRTGLDAAKNYGIVLSENVLTGWMSENGLDPTQERNDALTQTYRYQLMLEQLSGTSDQAMSEQIKHWAQLGDQINSTKQSLFSFDEVINLTSKETRIPEILDKQGNFSIEPKLDKPALDELYDYLKDNPALLDLLLQLPDDELAMFLEIIKNNPGALDVLLASIPTDDVNAFREWIRNHPSVQGIDIDIDRSVLESFKREVLNMVLPLQVKPTLIPGNYTSAFMANEREKYLGTSDSRSPQGSTGTGNVGAGNPAALLGSKIAPSSSALPYSGDSFDVNLTPKKTTVTTADGSTKSYLNTSSDSVTDISAHGIPTTSAKSLNAENITQQTQLDSRRRGSSIGEWQAIEAAIRKTGLDKWHSMGADERDAAIEGRKGNTFGNFATTAGGQLGDAWSGVKNFFGFASGGIGNFGFETGGIGTKEMDAKLIEGDKAEAIIPLKTSEGISYLADAMQQAGGGSIGGDELHFHFNLSGIFDTDDAYKWRQVAMKMDEQVTLLRQQRGSVGYGSGK